MRSTIRKITKILSTIYLIFSIFFSAKKPWTTSLCNRLNTGDYTLPLFDMARFWSTSLNHNVFKIFEHSHINTSFDCYLTKCHTLFSWNRYTFFREINFTKIFVKLVSRKMIWQGIPEIYRPSSRLILALFFDNFRSF